MAASQAGAPGSDCATCVAWRLAPPDSGSAAATAAPGWVIAAGRDAAIARGSAHAAGCRARACGLARGTARAHARVLALCSPPARPSGRARAREPPTPRVRRASWRDAARAPTNRRHAGRHVALGAACWARRASALRGAARPRGKSPRMAGHPLESVSPSLRVLIYTLAAAHLGALVRAIRPFAPPSNAERPRFPRSSSGWSAPSEDRASTRKHCEPRGAARRAPHAIWGRALILRAAAGCAARGLTADERARACALAPHPLPAAGAR